MLVPYHNVTQYHNPEDTDLNDQVFNPFTPKNAYLFMSHYLLPFTTYLSESGTVWAYWSLCWQFFVLMSATVKHISWSRRRRKWKKKEKKNVFHIFMSVPHIHFSGNHHSYKFTYSWFLGYKEFKFQVHKQVLNIQDAKTLILLHTEWCMKHLLALLC